MYVLLLGSPGCDCSRRWNARLASWVVIRSFGCSNPFLLLLELINPPVKFVWQRFRTTLEPRAKICAFIVKFCVFMLVLFYPALRSLRRGKLCWLSACVSMFYSFRFYQIKLSEGSLCSLSAQDRLAYYGCQGLEASSRVQWRLIRLRILICLHWATI